MQTRRHPIIRPPLQRLANIDHHFALPFTSYSEESVRVKCSTVLDLKATDTVLKEEGDDAEIEVRPNAAYGAFLHFLDGDGWVVEEAKLAGFAVAFVGE